MLYDYKKDKLNVNYKFKFNKCWQKVDLYVHIYNMYISYLRNLPQHKTYQSSTPSLKYLLDTDVMKVYEKCNI